MEILDVVQWRDAVYRLSLIHILAIALTTPVMCAMMAFMKMPIEWYMVFGSFLASFVVDVYKRQVQDTEELLRKFREIFQSMSAEELCNYSDDEVGKLFCEKCRN